MDPGRGGFDDLGLPEAGTLGRDVRELARDLYGLGEPVEGNYAEEFLTLVDSVDTQVVLFTITGLPDDSVRGMRYRLEFASRAEHWELAWAGRQLACWSGRGHRDWSTASCH